MSRPVCILIAAMGGEGGGVLADWLINAATEMEFPVQSTSVPGVAQRTGATTYYVEIFPISRKNLNGHEPVLSLTPTPGQIDLVAASELVEAGRAIQNGYVDPIRTVLVASLHREYAISEKMVMHDGRFNEKNLIDAAKKRSRKNILMDLRIIAQRHRTVINTVLFGVMASTGVLPFSRQVCENAIRKSGKAVESSLDGFRAGFELQYPSSNVADLLKSDLANVSGDYWPAELIRTVTLGKNQVADFQDEAYAMQYIDSITQITDLEMKLGIQTGFVSIEFARCLALRMCFDDLIKVADQKTRWSRLLQLRSEAGANHGEPVKVTEFLKPGIEEFISVMPVFVGKFLKSIIRKKHRSNSGGLKLRTDTIWGFFLLVFLRNLRPLRRQMHRFNLEEDRINLWSKAVFSAMSVSGELALELARCGAFVKGYGDTYERGNACLQAILDDVEIQMTARQSLDILIERVRKAREAASIDPSGSSLARYLGNTSLQLTYQPIKFYRGRS